MNLPEWNGANWLCRSPGGGDSVSGSGVRRILAIGSNGAAIIHHIKHVYCRIADCPKDRYSMNVNTSLIISTSLTSTRSGSRRSGMVIKTVYETVRVFQTNNNSNSQSYTKICSIIYFDHGDDVFYNNKITVFCLPMFEQSFCGQTVQFNNAVNTGARRMHLKQYLELKWASKRLAYREPNVCFLHLLQL